MNIFHAGDLNWWHWYDESDEFNINMSKAFKSQIDRLKNCNIKIAVINERGQEILYYA
jgi:hypothetical protein